AVAGVPVAQRRAVEEHGGHARSAVPFRELRDSLFEAVGNGAPKLVLDDGFEPSARRKDACGRARSHARTNSTDGPTESAILSFGRGATISPSRTHGVSSASDSRSARPLP